MQTHSSHTKHLHIMTYGKLVGCCQVLPGCRGAARWLPGAAGCCRVLPGTCPHIVSAGQRCRVYCRVLPGAAGCCRVAGLLPGCRVLPGCRGVAGSLPG